MHWLNKDNFGMSVMFQFEPGKAPITLTDAAVDRAKVWSEISGDD